LYYFSWASHNVIFGTKLPVSEGPFSAKVKEWWTLRALKRLKNWQFDTCKMMWVGCQKIGMRLVWSQVTHYWIMTINLNKCTNGIAMHQDICTSLIYLFHQVSMLMLKPLCLQMVVTESRPSATVTNDAGQPMQRYNNLQATHFSHVSKKLIRRKEICFSRIWRLNIVLFSTQHLHWFDTIGCCHCVNDPTCITQFKLPSHNSYIQVICMWQDYSILLHSMWIARKRNIRKFTKDSQIPPQSLLSLLLNPFLVTTASSQSQTMTASPPSA